MTLDAFCGFVLVFCMMNERELLKCEQHLCGYAPCCCDEVVVSHCHTQSRSIRSTLMVTAR